MKTTGEDIRRNDDGGPAFPRQLPKGKFSPDEILRIIENHSGMSLRDYFAVRVEIGHFTKNIAEAVMGEPPPAIGREVQAAYEFYDWWARAEAKYRYMHADAMLDERKK